MEDWKGERIVFSQKENRGYDRGMRETANFVDLTRTRK
jgi:hypothetical protein